MVTCATRTPATAKKSSLCDPTNKEPRRAKIPSGAAVFYRCGGFLASEGSLLGSEIVVECLGCCLSQVLLVPLGFPLVIHPCCGSACRCSGCSQSACLFEFDGSLHQTQNLLHSSHFNCIYMTRNILYHIFVARLITIVLVYVDRT